jgi:hypothetical protein
MKNAVFFYVIFLMIISGHSYGQVIVGLPDDSTTIRLNSTTLSNYVPDTSLHPLWQIGVSHKPFFATGSGGTLAIMTDTLHNYPRNANNWFVLKIPLRFNTIIDFWHKYQTDSMHAGGIVEFSTDSGSTWQNIKGACNADSIMFGVGIRTTNFYTFNDTILTGEPAFTGTSAGLQYSRFQFFNGLPISPRSTTFCMFTMPEVYLRFRFVSDTATDTLAGWMIDSIKIENNDYGSGAVANINKQNLLNVYPNPSYDGVFNFPALNNGQDFKIEIYNSIGARVLQMPYKRLLDLGCYPMGLYFYRVTDGVEYYSGDMVKE